MTDRATERPRASVVRATPALGSSVRAQEYLVVSMLSGVAAAPGHFRTDATSAGGIPQPRIREVRRLSEPGRGAGRF